MFYWRCRLKKDYDDFRRQPDYDRFTREQWINEDSEVNSGKEISSTCNSESTEHSEFPKRDYTDAGRCHVLLLWLPRYAVAVHIRWFLFRAVMLSDLRATCGSSVHFSPMWQFCISGKWARPPASLVGLLAGRWFALWNSCCHRKR